MEQNFKKVEAKFKVSKDWIDSNGKVQSVTVDLIIDYHNKTFIVTPNNQVVGKFTFCKGSVNSFYMWVAISEIIKEATFLVKQELKF